MSVLFYMFAAFSVGVAFIWARQEWKRYQPGPSLLNSTQYANLNG